MSQRFYSDEEADAILKLASRKSGDSSMSREMLLATASELGISPEAVEEAERSYRVEKLETSDRLTYTRHKRSEFVSALVGFLSTCGVLTVVNYLTSGALNWVFWVYFGCAFGLFGTFREMFLLSSDEREKSFRRWQRRRDRRERVAAGSRSGEEDEEDLVEKGKVST